MVFLIVVYSSDTSLFSM